MIIYAVNESFDDDAITISIHSTMGKAEKAKTNYEKECSKYRYWIEEFELDKEG